MEVRQQTFAQTFGTDWVAKHSYHAPDRNIISDFSRWRLLIKSCGFSRWE